MLFRLRHIIWIVVLGSLLAGGVGMGMSWWNASYRHASYKPQLHVYNWANYIPDVLIKKFEKETGITVIYSCFDSAETLETQLLLDAPYDVVFVPMWPVLVRSIQAKRLMPLNAQWLPHAQGVDQNFVRKIQCPLGYAMPYLWGTTGLGYDAKAVERAAPGAPRDSWAMIFDPVWAKKLFKIRITLTDSVTDVLQAILLYLGLPPNSQDIAVWDQAVSYMMKIRPFVHDFDSHQHLENLVSGQVAVLQGFASYIQMAAAENKDTDKDIRYVIPKEGVVMWIDLMAIPRRAPHPRLAHKFIDFMMRPENIAVATQIQRCPNAIPASHEFLDQATLENPMINLRPETMSRLHPDFVPHPELTRHLSRQWCKIKMNYRPRDPFWSYWSFWPFSKTCRKDMP